jgi:hypothetical protein
MEVLLKTEDEQQFNKLKNRLKILLGSENYKSLIDSSGVFGLRNKIIHHAEYCNRFQARSAIQAALYTLIAYSNFALQFRSSQEVIKFLDIVHELEHLKFFGENCHNKIFEDWSKKSLEAVFPDDLSSHLVYYYSLYQSDSERVKEKLENGFALAILIYAEQRSQTLSKAFEKIVSSMYDLPTPFKSVDAVEEYIEQNQESLCASIEIYKRYH